MQGDERKIISRDCFVPRQKTTDLTLGSVISAPRCERCAAFTRNLPRFGALNGIQKTRIARDAFFTGKARRKFKCALIFIHRSLPIAHAAGRIHIFFNNLYVFRRKQIGKVRHLQHAPLKRKRRAAEQIHYAAAILRVDVFQI